MPPITVGITGGIGAGKSIIAQVFQLLGISLYNADLQAKFIVANDPALKKSIIKLLGQNAYTDEGAYNSAYVSPIVFAEPLLLGQLNALIHPALALDFEKWVSGQHGAYILKEAALLIESESYQRLDYLIVVTAPEDLRIRRIRLRDNRKIEEIRGILEHQLTDDQRIEKADFVIKNDGQSLILPQVLMIDHHLKSLVSA